MATFHQYKNNAIGTVQNNPLASGGTSLITDSVLGANLATLTFPYYLTIWGANLNPNNDPNMEIVEVTANPSSNTFTISRAKQGTTAVAHAQGSNVGLLFTKGNFDEAVPQGSVAQGAIYYIGSDLLPHLLAAGGNGQFLTAGGVSADPSWTTVGGGAFYGDGSDGTVHLDGTNTFAFLTKVGNVYTMTRDMYATTIEIDGSCTLVTDGFIFYASVEIKGSGTIDYGAVNPGTDGARPAAGVGAASSGTGRFRTSPGGNGSAGNSGTDAPALSAVRGIGSQGGAGGGGGSGGGGGNAPSSGAAGALARPNTKIGIFKWNTYSGLDPGITTVAYFGGGGGGGGGAGGSNAGNCGGGGGGGASGGIVFGLVNAWNGSFTIKAVGGKGGDPGAGNGGGGGGGGGAGGCSVMIYATKTWSGSYTFTGGAGGTSGGTGSNGSNGPTGTSYEFVASSLA